MKPFGSAKESKKDLSIGNKIQMVNNLTNRFGPNDNSLRSYKTTSSSIDMSGKNQQNRKIK
jgi:hypothetical protein